MSKNKIYKAPYCVIEFYFFSTSIVTGLSGALISPIIIVNIPRF